MEWGGVGGGLERGRGIEGVEGGGSEGDGGGRGEEAGMRVEEK